MSDAPAPKELSAESLVAEAADDFLDRLGRGERPRVEEYTARYPRIADVLRQVLPALQVMRSVTPESAADGAAVAGPPPVGCLGDFRIVREVGRGGMGVVYEAEQISLGRRVALKVLPFAAALDARQLQRFKNEAHAAGQLHHPHMVPIHFVGSERGVHFYAMQLIDGQSLAEVVSQLRQRAGREPAAPGGPPGSLSRLVGDLASGRWAPDAPAAAGQQPTGPAADTDPRLAPGRATERSITNRAFFRTAARLGVQAAEALEQAHQLGVIHRDVKPANLLVDGRCHLWVTDFGLAQVQGDTRLTLTGDVLGTLRYMSPEQALARRGLVDHRTDVYSLGVTLYELLTLEPAVAGSDRAEILRRIAQEEPAPPRRLNRAVPAELETVVLKALAKDPAERYATAQELADDLQRFLEDKPIRARRPTAAQRLGKWCRRHKAVVAGAGVLALVAVLLAGGTALWWAAAERNVEQALGEAVRLQGEGKGPEALSAARRAEGLLIAGPVRPGLGRHVRRRRADLEMAVLLEDIRLRGSEVRGSSFDDARKDPDYEAAFREYGIDVGRLAPREAAERMQATTIPVELAAALDDWALVRRRTRKDEAAWKDLLALARAADPDDWRNQVRDALERGDAALLRRLGASERTAGLPPSTLVSLAEALRKNGAVERAAALLRQAQQQHPGDFWINHTLAETLTYLKAPPWDDVIRFQTAALALRPGSPGVYVNLGRALALKGAFADAKAAYEQALRLKPDYAMAYNNLGAVLEESGRPREAEAALRKAIELRPGFAISYTNLGPTLQDQGKLPEAEAACRKAIELRPDFAEAYSDLSGTLAAQGKLPEAEAACRKAIELQPDLAVAHGKLGYVLRSRGKLPEAEAACRKAIELQPDLALAYSTLGETLLAQGKLPEAEAACRKAVELGPENPRVYLSLGSVLLARGKPTEAEAACIKAVELGPDLAEAHNNLGSALDEQGKLPEAEAAFRKAIKLRPDLAVAYDNLGQVLKRRGKPAEAAAAHRTAIALRPDLARAHFHLGSALAAQQKLPEAVAAYRKAIDCRPEYAEAHCELGGVLLAQGQFAAALAEVRRGHELGSRQPGWAFPSALWVQHVERAAALAARLPAVLRGEARPADVAEQVGLAQLCQQPYKRLHAASARFYAAAFAAQPSLAGDVPAGHRYQAACAAALAGCGQGDDRPAPDEKERGRWRQQALDWLRADLAWWRQRAETGTPQDRAAVRPALQHWLADPDLAGVRGEVALALLPEAERGGWRRLWADVADTLGRAEGKTAPEERLRKVP
jgi:tetratricopeptide (TPR) repeat protein